MFSLCKILFVQIFLIKICLYFALVFALFFLQRETLMRTWTCVSVFVQRSSNNIFWGLKFPCFLLNFPIWIFLFFVFVLQRPNWTKIFLLHSLSQEYLLLFVVWWVFLGGEFFTYFLVWLLRVNQCCFASFAFDAVTFWRCSSGVMRLSCCTLCFKLNSTLRAVGFTNISFGFILAFTHSLTYSVCQPASQSTK